VLRVLAWIVAAGLVGFSLLACQGARADQLTASVDHDSWIDVKNPTDTYGAEAEMKVKIKDSKSEVKRSVVHFDLSLLPSAATIDTATVYLYVRDRNGGTDYIHRITDSWDESTVTWTNTAADHDTTAETSITPPTNGEYVLFEITSLVQDWVDGTSNYGIMLVPSDQDMETKYSTKDEGASGEHPYMEIVYTIFPEIVVQKTTSTRSDPINGTSNPKAVPGAVKRYTIGMTNEGSGEADSSSVMVTDAVPSNTELYVGDLGRRGVLGQRGHELRVHTCPRRGRLRQRCDAPSGQPARRV